MARGQNIRNKFGPQAQQPAPMPKPPKPRNAGPRQPRTHGTGPRKERDRPSLGGSGLAGETFTSEPTPAFAVQDPEAFFRNLQVQAGFDPMRNDAYGQFFNDMVDRWSAGWNQHQVANPAGNIYDYAASQGLGSIVTPGVEAAAPMSFDDFLRGKGIGQNQFKGLGQHRQQNLRTQHAGLGGTAEVPPVFTANAASLQQLLRQEFDKYGQANLYDPGKRPGSIRWNMYS